MTVTVFGLASSNVDKHKANRISINQLKVMISSVLTKNTVTLSKLNATLKTQLSA